MRKFIISDLHGNGDVYDSIMAYLENISMIDSVELYINGDLIDRGLDSYRMLEDVMDRIYSNDSIKIHYLGGNHELMMYNALKKKKPGKPLSFLNEWISNGGGVIDKELDLLENPEIKIKEYIDFLGELKIYSLFEEEVKNKPILLVHAQAPSEVLNTCEMKIGDNNRKVFNAVWTRKNDGIIFRRRLGKRGYLTILGHTIVENKDGFSYNQKENYINIDGGCSGYALGYREYNHVPLVEVCDDHLELLVWNHNNDIYTGYFFDGEFHKMELPELMMRKLYVDDKPKELIKEQ